MIAYLKTLCAVARHGTFAAAGDRVGLTQSAVSVQMRRLEQDLDLQLFDRSGRAAVLNANGRRVLAHAERIVGLYGQMAEGVADADLTGTLRVGAITTSLVSDVVDATARFRKRFPKVELYLMPGMSTELISLVEKERLDCALIVKPAFPVEGALRWRTLRQEPFVLITPPQERSSDVAGLLARRTFIRYDRRSYGGGLVNRFLNRKRLAVNEFVEMDSVETIALLVARGLGVAIVPRSPALQALGIGVREVELGEDTFYREIGMVEPAGGARAHLAADFWKVLARR